MSARMAAVDAQFYWMSVKVPNDEFLLYAFASAPVEFDRAVDEIHTRAAGCRQLTMRVDDGSALTYPEWVPAAVEPAQVLRHQLDDNSWRGCLDAVVRLADDQLNVRRAPWRLHLFAPVHGIPDSTGSGTVAVMQTAHALADGARASALAGWLFGRAAPVPDVTALPPSARLGPDCCVPRPDHGRRYPPMPGPPARVPCAPWCGAARSCEVPQSPSRCWPRCPAPYPHNWAMWPGRSGPRCR
jgi:hypothetical protein